MNREAIIRMAREADIEPNSYAGWLDIKELERFASLVASAEREACAKVCEYYAGTFNAHRIGECADAIRARGQA